MLRWGAIHGSLLLAAGVLLLGPTSCKEPNPAFDGPASAGSGSEGSGETGTTGTSGTTTDVITTMTVGGTGSTSLEPGTSTGPVPLESSSSGGTGEGPLYPPCMLEGDPVCPEPYDQCYDFLAPDYTVCTMPCAEDDDCPQPATGDAQPQCAGQGNDQCLLDCADDATCPDGMECQQVAGMFERCVWPS